MPELDFEEDQGTIAGKLLQTVAELTGAACVDCARSVCGHEALFAVAMGFKSAPRCLGCLARGLDREAGPLRDELTEFMQQRDCYRQAWDAASDREALPRGPRPRCLWQGCDPAATPMISAQCPAAPENTDTYVEHWDAGDLACGDLVLALRGRLMALPPTTVLKVTARDPAAPLDLPAWCRLTGHRLLRGEHPDYFIRRKEG